jgi:hypothetical protein
MMVKRCLDLKDAIILLINTDPLFGDIKILPEEWLKFEEICNFLELLYELTLIMSSEKTPTIGFVIPLLDQLSNHFETYLSSSEFEFVRDCCRKALEKTNKYYKKTHLLHLIACVLDPRLGLDYFEEKGINKHDIKNAMNSVYVKYSEGSSLQKNNVSLGNYKEISLFCKGEQRF